MSRNVLVAEDEEHIAKLIAFKLARQGFEVKLARNGKEALELLGSAPWDLVVLDVMMPVMDGWQVLRELRSQPEYRLLPVLMLTAKGHSRDVSTAMELGAQRYLKKPFDPQELSEIADEMITGAARA